MTRSLVVIALVLTACGGGAGATTTTDSAAPVPTTAADSSAATAAPGPAGTTTTVAIAAESCGEDATGIEIGSPVADQVDLDGDFTEKLYFCVDVPGGVSTLTVTLSGQEADLNVYVGYPDLETVQNGGFTFWFSDNNTTDDETVVINRGGDRLLDPGPYYIEVSSPDGRGLSPFGLVVETG